MLAGSGLKTYDRSDEKRVAAVITECTDTIRREFAGLKAMVDEFSRFYRLPATRLELANLNEVVAQAVGLYEERLDGVAMKVEVGPIFRGNARRGADQAGVCEPD